MIPVHEQIFGAVVYSALVFGFMLTLIRLTT
jgi:hypothetical protein